MIKIRSSFFSCIKTALTLLLLTPYLWANTPTFTPPTPNVSAKSFVIADAATGMNIAQKNAHERLGPASLTKLLSLYIAANALKEGHINLEDKVYISKKAWKTDGSRMFVQEGKYVPLSELIQGIAVASGNDATVALAEHIAGSTEAFAALMNQTAKTLNMDESHFTNPTGLSDKEHYTTANDLAKLAQAWLRDFPEYYPWLSQKRMQYGGIKQLNRNRLLWRDTSVDGMKTGHTDAAGFCLVASANRDNTRMITVLLGSKSDEQRFQDAQQLLAYAFRFFKTETLATAQSKLFETRVLQGSPTKIAVGVEHAVNLTRNRYEKGQVSLKPHFNKPIVAPIHKGDAIGTLSLILPNQTTTSVPLIALEESERGSLWRVTIDWFKQYLG